jgi:hypothetical protein
VRIADHAPPITSSAAIPTSDVARRVFDCQRLPKWLLATRGASMQEIELRADSAGRHSSGPTRLLEVVRAQKLLAFSERLPAASGPMELILRYQKQKHKCGKIGPNWPVSKQHVLQATRASCKPRPRMLEVKPGTWSQTVLALLGCWIAGQRPLHYNIWATGRSQDELNGLSMRVPNSFKRSSMLTSISPGVQWGS